jgi:hypothetical protein
VIWNYILVSIDSEAQVAAAMRELRNAFAHPEDEFGPCPTWWWSGETVEPERLRWQMDRMAEGGIRQFVVLNLAPSGPLYGKETDDPPHFSERWWECFKSCCAHAKTLGMRVWFYDQLGFANANLQGQLCADHEICRGQTLESRLVEGRGPTVLEFPTDALPGAAFLLRDRAGDDPPELPIVDEKAICSESGNWRVLLVFARISGFDYLSSIACKLLREKLYGEFERRVPHLLGSVIAGSFQDELPSLPTWSREFETAFQQHAGYALRPSLWALFLGDSPHAQRVRRDYQSVRLHLAEEAFFRPAFEWHEKYGMLNGCDQQGYARRGYPLDTVIHYADYLRSHRWYIAPGADHHGEIRLHSSLAAHYERKRVWFESFHSSGWGGTLEETFDWLLPWWVAGANLYNPHAIYYTTRRAWWEWAPPSTCWRQPYWRHYAEFSRAVARINAILTLGKHACDLAVLHPTSTVQAWLTLNGPLAGAKEADETYRKIIGEHAWYAPEPGPLDRLAIDYAIVDEASIQDANIIEGRLCCGACSYNTVVLPACCVLEDSTAIALEKFVDQGGNLVAIGRIPESARLEDAFRSQRAYRLRDVEELERWLRDNVVPMRVLDTPLPARVLRYADIHFAFLPLAYPGATVQDGGKDWWEGTDYTFHPERYRRGMTVSIRDTNCIVEIWDPVTGMIQEVAAEQAESRTVVRIPDDASPAVFLVWRKGNGQPFTKLLKSQWEVLEELRDWHAELEPTLDNQYGDFALPAHPGAPPLQTWKLRYRTGDVPRGPGAWAGGTFDAVFTTFGHQGWLRKELADWKPCIYSSSRGLKEDRVHAMSLGASGHVPDEFIDAGPVRTGECITFHTHLWFSTERSCYLAVGAPGNKRAKINERVYRQDKQGFQWITHVKLARGWNRIEWSFVSEEDGFGRCYWTLLERPDDFVRPEFLQFPKGMHSGRVRFRKQFELPFDSVRGRVMVFATHPCSISLDDATMGRLGGFMPYGHRDVAVTLEVCPLKRGGHHLVIDVDAGATDFRLLVDGWFESTNGDRCSLLSDASWTAEAQSGRTAPAKIRMGWGTHLSPGSTSRDVYLVRRPHPLPHAHWLQGTNPDTNVLTFTPDPMRGEPTEEWFQWTIPPQAKSMMLSLSGSRRLWINGREIKITDDKIHLPASEDARVAVLCVHATAGPRGGAVWLKPITYHETAAGRMPLGDWCDLGLDAYSGGVRYFTEWNMAEPNAGTLVLDLGQVRGTAEVMVNGINAGCRFLSPWTFDVTKYLRPGKNRIEILVLNTLGPLFASCSPSPYVRRGQTTSGLLGPVRLLRSSWNTPELRELSL